MEVRKSHCSPNYLQGIFEESLSRDASVWLGNRFGCFMCFCVLSYTSTPMSLGFPSNLKLQRGWLFEGYVKIPQIIPEWVCSVCFNVAQRLLFAILFPSITP